MHKGEIDAKATKQEKLDLLCEKNVIEQVANVCHTNNVQSAWKANKDLTIHGWIYSIENGLLKSLDTEINDTGRLHTTYSFEDHQPR